MLRGAFGKKLLWNFRKPTTLLFRMLLLLASFTYERDPLLSEGPLKVERKMLREDEGCLLLGKKRAVNFTKGSGDTVELS